MTRFDPKDHLKSPEAVRFYVADVLADPDPEEFRIALCNALIALAGEKGERLAADLKAAFDDERGS